MLSGPYCTSIAIAEGCAVAPELKLHLGDYPQVWAGDDADGGRKQKPKLTHVVLWQKKAARRRQLFAASLLWGPVVI